MKYPDTVLKWGTLFSLWRFVNAAGYFDAIADALEAAKEEIFITAWWYRLESATITFHVLSFYNSVGTYVAPLNVPYQWNIFIILCQKYDFIKDGQRCFKIGECTERIHYRLFCTIELWFNWLIILTVVWFNSCWTKKLSIFFFWRNILFKSEISVIIYSPCCSKLYDFPWRRILKIHDFPLHFDSRKFCQTA